MRFLNSVKREETFWGFAFILPNFLGFLLFTSLPVLVSIGLAFCKWDILTSPEFVGLRNFKDLLGFHRDSGILVPNDPLFWKYLFNTMFLMLVIPVNIFGSLLLAILLTRKIRGVIVFRTLYFLPTICSGVALCFLWRWLLASDLGLINSTISGLAGLVGLSVKTPAWLTDPAWAKPALMLMSVWGAIGGTSMILYMAALTGVPGHLYEAAEIDGANSWQKFIHITWPMVSPTTFFIFIMSVIGGFQGGFMQAFSMTGGGPAGATTTLEYYIYTNAYQNFNMGYASSIAMVLFAIILIVTFINWKYGGSRVTY